MMEKIFHFAESHQNVDRFIFAAGWSGLAIGAVVAVILIFAFLMR